MKVCPLITQALMLDSDREILLGETENNEIHEEESTKDEEIFINPDVTAKKEKRVEKGIRFVGKSFKGEVTCLENLCRFYDEDENTCKFEKLMKKISDFENTEPVLARMEEQFNNTTEEINSIKRKIEEKLVNLNEKLGTLEEKQDSTEEILNETKGKVEEFSSNLSSTVEGIKAAFDEATKPITEKIIKD